VLAIASAADRRFEDALDGRPLSIRGRANRTERAVAASDAHATSVTVLQVVVAARSGATGIDVEAT
jgi:hypothetical protein